MAPSTGESTATITMADGGGPGEALVGHGRRHVRRGHDDEVDGEDQDDRGHEGRVRPVVHGPGAQLGPVEPHARGQRAPRAPARDGTSGSAAIDREIPLAQSDCRCGAQPCRHDTVAFPTPRPSAPRGRTRAGTRAPPPPGRGARRPRRRFSRRMAASSIRPASAASAAATPAARARLALVTTGPHRRAGSSGDRPPARPGRARR